MDNRSKMKVQLQELWLIIPRGINLGNRSHLSMKCLNFWKYILLVNHKKVKCKIFVFVTLNIKKFLTYEFNIFFNNLPESRTLFFFLIGDFLNWWPRCKISSFPMEVQEPRNWILKGLLNDRFISISFITLSILFPPLTSAHQFYKGPLFSSKVKS